MQTGPEMTFHQAGLSENESLKSNLLTVKSKKKIPFHKKSSSKEHDVIQEYESSSPFLNSYHSPKKTRKPTFKRKCKDHASGNSKQKKNKNALKDDIYLILSDELENDKKSDTPLEYLNTSENLIQLNSTVISIDDDSEPSETAKDKNNLIDNYLTVKHTQDIHTTHNIEMVSEKSIVHKDQGDPIPVSDIIQAQDLVMLPDYSSSDLDNQASKPKVIYPLTGNETKLTFDLPENEERSCILENNIRKTIDVNQLASKITKTQQAQNFLPVVSKDSNNYFCSEPSLNKKIPVSNQVLNFVGQFPNIRNSLEMTKFIPKIIQKALYESFLANYSSLRWSDEMFLEKSNQFFKALDKTTKSFLDPPEVLFNTSWISKFSSSYISYYKSRLLSERTNKHKNIKSLPYVNINSKRSLSRHYSGFLSEYSPENIFCASTTGLYYRLLPSEALASEMLSGINPTYERLATVLCTNSTGTEKIPPWVISSNIDPQIASCSHNKIESVIESQKLYSSSVSNLERSNHKRASIINPKHHQSAQSSANSSNNRGKKANEVKDTATNTSEYSAKNSDLDPIYDSDEPFYLRFNTLSVISHTMFLEWLQWFDARMVGRKVLLLLRDSEKIPFVDYHLFSNIRILYIPQYISFFPTESNLTLSWKLSYRVRFFDFLLSRFGISTSSHNLGFARRLNGLKSITSSIISIIDAAQLMSDSWIYGTSPSSVCAAFKKFEKFIQTGDEPDKSSTFSSSTDTDPEIYEKEEAIWAEIESQSGILQLLFSRTGSENAQEPGTAKSFYEYFNTDLYSKMHFPWPEIVSKSPKVSSYRSLIAATLAKAQQDNRHQMDFGRIVNYPTENQVSTCDFSDMEILNMFIAEYALELRSLAKQPKN